MSTDVRRGLEAVVSILVIWLLQFGLPAQMWWVAAVVLFVLATVTIVMEGYRVTPGWALGAAVISFVAAGIFHLI